jgi:hypothetical protein
MTEAEFQQAIDSKQANFQTPETPDLSKLSLEELEKKLNDYIPLLEKLRIKGDAVYGRIYQTSNQSIPDSSDTKVTLSVKSFAKGVTADVTNNQFIIQSEGYYQVKAVLHYNAPTSGKFYEAELSVNDVLTNLGTSRVVASGTAAIAIVLHDILYCKVRDKISLYTYHNTGAASSTLAGSGLSFLNISRL